MIVLILESARIRNCKVVDPDPKSCSIQKQNSGMTRVHYGYRRVNVMLGREGWRDVDSIGQRNSHVKT